MDLSKLRCNQLSAGAWKWYQRYLAALDAKDLPRYAQFLAADCMLQFNSAPAVSGKTAITGLLDAYWRSFGELRHEPLNIYGEDRRFVLEALNHYTRLDGRAVTVRAVAFTDRDEAGQVTSVRLYADTAELFA